ncbi:MAG: MBL fold metallo-hydrolase, partial [Rhizobiaceae bacterium]
TPGHSAFEVQDGSESLMIVGDSIANHHVAFEYPKWHAGFDQDHETAVKTRLSLLDQLAAEKKMIIGYHLPHPGIGRVEKKDSAYRFVAA